MVLTGIALERTAYFVCEPFPEFAERLGVGRMGGTLDPVDVAVDSS